MSRNEGQFLHVVEDNKPLPLPVLCWVPGTCRSVTHTPALRELAASKSVIPEVGTELYPQQKKENALRFFKVSIYFPVGAPILLGGRNSISVSLGFLCPFPGVVSV